MHLEPGYGIAIFLISFLGYFIKGIAGFGDPLITSPLFSMFLDNRLISPNNLLLSMPLNGYIAWKNRCTFSPRTTLPVLAFILLGVIPGTMLLKYATSWILKAGLGVLVLGIGLEMITRNRAKAHRHNSVLMAIVCFFSGVTSGLYGINLFFVAYMERTSGNRDVFRGNICFIFFLESVCRLVVYLATGVMTRQVLLLTLLTIPGMALGFLAGLRFYKKLSDRSVRYFVIAVFMLGGLSILLKALVWKQ